MYADCYITNIPDPPTVCVVTDHTVVDPPTATYAGRAVARRRCTLRSMWRGDEGAPLHAAVTGRSNARARSKSNSDGGIHRPHIFRWATVEDAQGRGQVCQPWARGAPNSILRACWQKMIVFLARPLCVVCWICCPNESVWYLGKARSWFFLPGTSAAGEEAAAGPAATVPEPRQTRRF